jgi:hypothetical protein
LTNLWNFYPENTYGEKQALKASREAPLLRCARTGELSEHNMQHGSVLERDLKNLQKDPLQLTQEMTAILNDECGRMQSQFMELRRLAR